MVQPDERAIPIGKSDPTIQEAIPDINTEDIALLEQWAVGSLQDMATPTIGSQGTTIPDSRSMPRLIRKDAQRKVEERTKRRMEELASESGSSSKEEEYKDSTSTSNSSEEEEGMESPSQPHLVEEPKTLPFKIHRPTIYSTPGRPTARP